MQVLSACLNASLSVGLNASLNTGLSTGLSACLSASLSTSLSAGGQSARKRAGPTPRLGTISGTQESSTILQMAVYIVYSVALCV